MNIRAQLSTILRRLADRLAPAPAGDCGSGATWINYTTDGVQFSADARFELGEGWSPA